MARAFRRDVGDEDFRALLDEARRNKRHVRVGLERGGEREGRVGPVDAATVTVGGKAVPLADITWAELLEPGVNRCG